VLILVVFMLLQRSELRDRLLRLMGGDPHLMADALSESAQRVSRYLAAQVLVNLGYGLPMALGLWWIGVPGAWLWGGLAAVLRFVPYLGPAIGAVFPVVAAFAVDPGWSMVLWTLGLIALLELISNNVIEPLAYGGSTGVSPVAVLLSAAFWAHRAGSGHATDRVSGGDRPPPGTAALS
jgi:predicted PurR-regulated permease PerM